MILKLSLILSMVLAIGVVLISYVLFTRFRNVYTQKVLFLNDEFKNLSTEQIVRYRIGRAKRFWAKLEFESLYPPKVITEYLVNEEYQNLIDRLSKKQSALPKIVKKTFIIFAIVLGLHLLVYAFIG